MAAPGSNLRTVAYVADWLGCSTKTVRRLIDEGDLPEIRVRASVRVRDSDVLAFIERGRIKTEHAPDERPARPNTRPSGRGTREALLRIEAT
jgi:excisionase family DNA binding protein